MRNVGLMLILTGLVSFALLGTNFRVIWLLWIDGWGREVGLGLRAAILLLGIILYAVALARAKARGET
jgi:hypothetical protein